MYVRTVYATGDPARLEGVLDTLGTEGRELVSREQGFRGMSLFADREVGKLMVGTWWEDQQSQQASDDHVREQRTAMLAPFATTAVTDVWEAAVAQRPEAPLAPGACFRFVRLEFDPSDAELLADTFRTLALPRLQAMPGFAGASLLMNSARNQGTVGALYTDRASFEASRAPVAALRGEATKKARVVTRSLEEFDVVFVALVRPA